MPSAYKSKAEYEIIDFLKQYNIKNIKHSWENLGFEINIFLPTYNLAIEYNNLSLNSSNLQSTDKEISQQHLSKTEICEKNNIHLLHILDIEWNDPLQKEIWKSTILHKLNKSTNKIYARKCDVSKISHKCAIEFLNENHLQGGLGGAINLGLFYNTNLLAVGTFSKSRFRYKQQDKYELIRFASKLNTSVPGGFSKIISEFKKYHNYGTLISYANRRWSMGNVYKQIGFQLTNTSDPCYYYTDNKNMWHRSIFQKHKLKEKLENFNPQLTEVKNMYNHNYRRIWDCGTLTYELDLSI